ncbi:MAG: hypothetical protein ACOYO1_16850 [Bacteroidales bacterium]
MKKRNFLLLTMVVFITLCSCNDNTKKIDGAVVTKDSVQQITNSSTSNSEFPYEKAKQAALESIGSSGNVLGYYKESDNKINMFILGDNGQRWTREFILLSTDKKDVVWLMLIAPFGSSDTRFKLLE